MEEKKGWLVWLMLLFFEPVLVPVELAEGGAQ